MALSNPSVCSTPAALLHDADLAMYRAKQRKHLGSSWELYAGDPIVTPSSIGPAEQPRPDLVAARPE